jgi:hypothetical protein
LRIAFFRDFIGVLNLDPAFFKTLSFLKGQRHTRCPAYTHFARGHPITRASLDAERRNYFFMCFRPRLRRLATRPKSFIVPYPLSPAAKAKTALTGLTVSAASIDVGGYATKLKRYVSLETLSSDHVSGLERSVS